MCSLLQQTYIRQPGIIPQQGNTVNENTKSDFHTKKAITLEDTQIYDLPWNSFRANTVLCFDGDVMLRYWWDMIQEVQFE